MSEKVVGIHLLWSGLRFRWCKRVGVSCVRQVEGRKGGKIPPGMVTGVVLGMMNSVHGFGRVFDYLTPWFYNLGVDRVWF